jgi:hypothetical protein
MYFILKNVKSGLITTAIFLLAVTPVATRAEEVSSFQNPQPVTQVVPLTATKEAIRLESIGFRIASANSDKCDNPEMLSGMLVHDPSNYAGARRAEIVRQSNLTFGFGIIAILPDSPAEQAGLRLGDEIVGINGASLQDPAYDRMAVTASYDRIEDFTTKIGLAMKVGPAQLDLLRNGEKMSLTITGIPGCGGRMSYQPSNQLNAWADGHYVAVTRRMMGFASDDAELSFVIAHEMAHNIKKHPQALQGHSSLLAAFGLGAGKFHKSEAEADDFAITLMAAADIDVGGASRLMRRFSGVSLLYLSPMYPSVPRRLAILKNAVDRLSAGQTQLASSQQVGPLIASAP